MRREKRNRGRRWERRWCQRDRGLEGVGEDDMRKDGREEEETRQR